MARRKKITKDDKLKLEKELEIEEFKENEEKQKRRRFVFFVLIFLVLLFFSTFGITVSFYKGGSKEPQIIETNPTPTPTSSPAPTNGVDTSPRKATDSIIFTYSDVDRGGNGINLVNAIPISDTKGKIMVGKDQYFDFSVTATSKSSNLLYKILIRKDDKSTLDNKNVRIYLTTTSGSYEKEVVLTTFSNLKKQKIDGVDYYVLYEKTLDKGISNYSDFYRLRMWVSEDAIDYNDKTFMLKVDVIAEQVGD